MAGQAVTYVVGVLGSALTYFSFGPERFGAQQGGASVIRLGIGLDGNGLTGAGGGVPDVRLYNEDGGFLGLIYDPGFAGSGTTRDLVIPQSDGQVTYGLFTANDDAICIAYASIVRPDGQRYGWVGNWASECGHDWSFSNIQIGGKQVNCIWTVASPDRPTKAFQVHWPDFWSPDAVDFPYDNTYYCEAGPPFKVYYNYDHSTIEVLTREERGLEKLKVKRSARNGAGSTSSVRRLTNHDKIRQATASQLIISDKVHHSAAELCGSPSSSGPDFVNVVEGQFCHMGEKTLYPVCCDRVKDNCFNMATMKLVVGGVSTRDVDYHRVVDWT